MYLPASSGLFEGSSLGFRPSLFCTFNCAWADNVETGKGLAANTRGVDAGVDVGSRAPL